ncbi:MAG: hypothetical protein LRY51_07880, partial [Geovibrio sp.]|nr:hypothetical protein [Geovibrio sp.]
PSVDHPGTERRYVRGLDPMFEHPAEKGNIPDSAQVYFYADAKKEGKLNLFLRPMKAPVKCPTRISRSSSPQEGLWSSGTREQ